jgi:hypothetical protein
MNEIRFIDEVNILYEKRQEFEKIIAEFRDLLKSDRLRHLESVPGKEDEIRVIISTITDKLDELEDLIMDLDNMIEIKQILIAQKRSEFQMLI